MSETTQKDDCELAEYLAAEPEQRLRMVRDDWQKATDDRARAFFEGRMLELTFDMDEHPAWFDHGCMCATCRSYG